MEYFKISLRPHKKIVNTDYCESLIFESFTILGKTGQVYNNFQVVREENGYSVYAIMPGADALDLAFCSEETVEIVKKIAAIFSLRVESLGNVITCEDSCTCEEPTWYMLYSDLATSESPMICGDCGKPVPLYKLPMILDNEGGSVLLNWQEEKRAISMLDTANYAPEYTAEQIYSPSSRLNKTGRALCRAIEKAKNVPVFYYMELEKAKRGNNCPICGRELSRSANNEIAGNLCTFCRIALD